VCGDDRVRGTREHMLLMQVVLVRLSRGAGISWDFHVYVLYLWIVINCKGSWPILIRLPDFVIMDFRYFINLIKF